MHKGQLDGPVVGQVQRAPLRVVELGLGEIEVAGLGKIALAEAEVEIAGRISAVAEDELPSEVEEQLLARRHSGQCLGRRSLGIAGEQRGGACPGRAGNQRRSRKSQSGREQIATGDARHGDPLSDEVSPLGAEHEPSGEQSGTINHMAAEVNDFSLRQ